MLLCVIPHNIVRFHLKGYHYHARVGSALAMIPKNMQVWTGDDGGKCSLPMSGLQLTTQIQRIRSHTSCINSHCMHMIYPLHIHFACSRMALAPRPVRQMRVQYVLARVVSVQMHCIPLEIKQHAAVDDGVLSTRPKPCSCKTARAVRQCLCGKRSGIMQPSM